MLESEPPRPSKHDEGAGERLEPAESDRPKAEKEKNDRRQPSDGTEEDRPKGGLDGLVDPADAKPKDIEKAYLQLN